MRVDTNLWGVVIIMDHNEAQALPADAAKVTATLGGAGGALTAVLGAAGVAAAAAALIATAVVAAITAEVALIAAVDKGNGSYVTIPWPAIFAAAPVLIPTTAPAVTPPPGPNWAAAANGVFGTSDQADRISYVVEHNVAPFTLISMRLVIGRSSSGWWKSIQMPFPTNQVVQATGWGATAEGLEIWVSIKGHPEARVVFSKAGIFGIHHPVLQLGGLQGLQNRDRVTFTWEAD